VVEAEQQRPVGLAVGPAANAGEVLGAVAELVGAPGEQEDVLGRPQPQQGVVEGIDAEDDDAAAGALDLAAELLLDLGGGDLLEAGLDEGVAGGGLGRGAGSRHGGCGSTGLHARRVPLY
jgi:hypothetical protein